MTSWRWMNSARAARPIRASSRLCPWATTDWKKKHAIFLKITIKYRTFEIERQQNLIISCWSIVLWRWLIMIHRLFNSITFVRYNVNHSHFSLFSSLFGIILMLLWLNVLFYSILFSSQFSMLQLFFPLSISSLSLADLFSILFISSPLLFSNRWFSDCNQERFQGGAVTSPPVMSPSVSSTRF